MFKKKEEKKVFVVSQSDLLQARVWRLETSIMKAGNGLLYAVNMATGEDVLAEKRKSKKGEEKIIEVNPLLVVINAEGNIVDLHGSIVKLEKFYGVEYLPAACLQNSVFHPSKTRKVEKNLKQAKEQAAANENKDVKKVSLEGLQAEFKRVADALKATQEGVEKNAD